MTGELARHNLADEAPTVTVRAPSADETGRAAYLFRHGLFRPHSRLLVAVRHHPVERFVAAAAWWPEGPVARFHLVRTPGNAGPLIFRQLIDEFAQHAREAGLQRLQYADLLKEDDEVCATLVETGFEPQSANRFFEATCHEAAARVKELGRIQRSCPPEWRTESIRYHTPQLAFELIQNYGLLPPAELELYWQGNIPGGFDLDSSAFLFAGPRPCGVLLVRAGSDTFYVDVRVVQEENRHRRALGNLMLFQHMTERWNEASPIIRLQFHGGAAEHRETANLALRMGGRELPSRHIYAKVLG